MEAFDPGVKSPRVRGRHIERGGGLARFRVARLPALLLSFWRRDPPLRKGPHRQSRRDRRPGHPGLPRRWASPTVAVFSEADRESLHVMLADEAALLGPAPAAESYLAIDRIIAAARGPRAPSAVHPGYGFLAENAAFAEACAAAGLVFIGPPPAAIRAMGDKIAARRVAMADEACPWCPAPRSPSRMTPRPRALPQRSGYPVMIKAAMGGGGKGMRLVRAPGELAGALRAARSEAGARLRRRRRLHRALHRGAAPHRDPGARRRARQRGASRRARVLDPAPPPEADRGEPVVLRDPGAAPQDGRGRLPGGRGRRATSMPARSSSWSTGAAASTSSR